MPSYTTHYNLAKPDVNSATDEDLWGDQLNTNFDTIDTTLYALASSGGGWETGDFCVSARTSKTGWVLCSGATIGSAASGATNRANADTEDLFTELWTNFTNTELPIQDSSGNATTRGTDAASDFAANKRLPVPDIRGRSFFGKDNMGGTAASRVTTAASGVDGATLGATGGSQTHTLTVPEIPAHTHTINAQNNATTGGAFLPQTTAQNAVSSSITTQSTGGGGAHNNMPPAFIANVFIKL